VEFAGGIERFHPSAHVAERNRLSFDSHGLGQRSMRHCAVLRRRSVSCQLAPGLRQKCKK
jgi:hypothetical protein